MLRSYLYKLPLWGYRNISIFEVQLILKCLPLDTIRLYRIIISICTIMTARNIICITSSKCLVAEMRRTLNKCELLSELLLWLIHMHKWIILAWDNSTIYKWPIYLSGKIIMTFEPYTCISVLRWYIACAFGNMCVTCTITTNDQLYVTWASYQIRKIVGCAFVGNAGNVFPATDFKGNH